MTADDYTQILKDIYGGRRWILTADVLAGCGLFARAAKDLGASAGLCVAGSWGTGSGVDPDFAPDPIVLGTSGQTTMEAMRNAAAAMQNLSAQQQAQIDAFDPDGTAMAIGPPFSDGLPIGGRRLYGGRPESWRRLEDKMIIDALWQELEVPCAPFEIVQAKGQTMLAAAARLNQGLGTVWVGDNRQGWHGGAEYLRWIRTSQDEKDAIAFFEARCDHIRVQPFMEGIPCSIHGLVLEEVTLAFRPCEMLVLRKPDQSKLHYARAATFWDPPEADRQNMRQLARRIGDHLRQRIDYRGFFTLDGVMTAEGFRPTELNPRFGAASGLLLGGLPQLNLYFLHMAVVEREPVDWKPQILERLILESADNHRSGSAMAMTQRQVDQTHRVTLGRDPQTGHLCEVTQDQPWDAKLMLGPSPTGGYLGMRMNPQVVPKGPSAAPLAVETLMWANQRWDLGLGTLEAARDLRNQTSNT